MEVKTSLGEIMSYWTNSYFLGLRVCHIETLRPDESPPSVDTVYYASMDSIVLIDEFYSTMGIITTVKLQSKDRNQ